MELFNDQNYEKIRKHHAELGVPWTDPKFTASDSSIGLSKIQKLPRNVQWKRPRDIVKEPKLVVDGTSPSDVTQGRLGNCWFVAACSVLAGCREMWERVVPDHQEQEFDNKQREYSGAFRFRFWRFGKWVEVVIDDLLPVYTNEKDELELLFIHSSSKREFWGSLLEKAYSKLHGSYAVLDGGNLSDALVDFTSGVSEIIDLRVKNEELRNPEDKKLLFNTIQEELGDHALMCAAITAESETDMEERTEFGLVKGHAYGVIEVKRIPLGETNLISFFKGREKLSLVRLRNPWGQKEWNGAFSHKSPEWTNISDKEKEKLGLTFDADGDFWMPFDDFLRHFTEMSICRLLNTSYFSLSKTWKEAQLFGNWAIRKASDGRKKDVPNRAGGCLNFRDSFLENPQFRFDVPRVEDDDDQEIIIQLSQSDARSNLLSDKRENKTIGFHIMRIESNRTTRVHRLDPDSNVATSDYIKTKHIFLREKLPKDGGRFVVVPTTFNPGETTDFLLRIFTQQQANVNELVFDIPPTPWYKKCYANDLALVTRITIIGAKRIENKETFGKTDPYAYIKCEGHTVKSSAIKDTLNPVWNFSAIFYRRKPAVPIKIQIWNSNLIVDTFLGQVFLLAPPRSDDLLSEETLTLVGRKSKRAETQPGELKVHVESSEILTKL